MCPLNLLDCAIVKLIKQSICPSSSVALPQLAAVDGRDALPKADWVLLAEGNQTALTSDAFRQAQLADQNTQAKVERIERMMNNSLQHNEQILRNGADALQKLAKDEQRPNGGGTNAAAAHAAIAVTFLAAICPFLWHFLTDD